MKEQRKKSKEAYCALRLVGFGFIREGQLSGVFWLWFHKGGSAFWCVCVRVRGAGGAGAAAST
jgi:hypothetical protein